MRDRRDVADDVTGAAATSPTSVAQALGVDRLALTCGWSPDAGTTSAGVRRPRPPYSYADLMGPADATAEDVRLLVS